MADTEGTLLWISDDPARARAVVGAAAREFNLELRLSDHEGVSRLTRAGDFNIVGIEFGIRGHSRRRGVDSPTGAFVVAVPYPIIDESTILKVTLRGGRTVNLNR